MHPLNEDTRHYFLSGTLEDAYRHFGAHLMKDKNGHVTATRFTVYAPHARAVSVVGEFNDYQDWVHQMTKVDAIGVWRIDIPEHLEWKAYKYKIFTHDGRELHKSDPYAFFSAERPDTVSKVYDIDGYQWNDHDYMQHRKRPYSQPVNIYEVHLGSWMKKPDGTYNRFTDLVDRLIPYALENGFTHLEIMPLVEHPLDQSWGYQGTGYYSITSRYGVPKDFMYFVDRAHQAGLGIILDWVPGHICKDAHGLYMFDGQPLYEYRDPWIRENIVWGTANLDLARAETRSFLISNALFFQRYFHIDGIRVDAVANIVHPLGDARYGVNDGALGFLRMLSRAVFKENDAFILAAEDSTAFPGVTRPVDQGGLGFNYKWNMGWMNDTLRYFAREPIHRKYHQSDINFAMHYAYSENFILPLSHDEVVHGKRSIVEKMPGDDWQKFANARALYGFMYTHPGKKLLFMGQEFGQRHEWRDHDELDWSRLNDDPHQGLHRFHRDIAHLVKHQPALHALDHDPAGFRWIDADNADESVLTYIRHGHGQSIIVAVNLTPVVRQDFWLAMPEGGNYVEILNSDAIHYGGSGITNDDEFTAFEHQMQGFNHAIRVSLPPLGVSLFKRSD